MRTSKQAAIATLLIANSLFLIGGCMKYNKNAKTPNEAKQNKTVEQLHAEKYPAMELHPQATKKSRKHWLKEEE